MVTTRRGYGKGMGCGYKNLMPKDSYIHGLSAKGVKTVVVYPMDKWKLYNDMNSTKYFAKNPDNMVFTVKMKMIKNPPKMENWHTGQRLNAKSVSVWSCPCGYGGTKSEFSKHAKTCKVLKQAIERDEKFKASLNAKGTSINKEMAKKFSEQQLKALNILNYTYHPSQNIWGLKWSKKPSELFILETQLGISHREAKELVIKYLDTLEKYPYEQGMNFMGYSLNAKKSCIDKYIPPVKPKQYFDSRLIKQGIKVEMEHTKNKKIAKRIALAHLNESKNYYYELAKMEANLK